MAMLKSIEMGNGATANYHKIVKVEFLKATNTVELTINSYVDETKRAQEKVLWQERIQMPLTDEMMELFYGWATTIDGSPYLGATQSPDEPAQGETDVPS